MENNMSMVFDAKSENEGLARMVISAFITELDPTIEELNDVKTAVSEAVTNSIIHGYNGTEGKVYMDCSLDMEENENLKEAVEKLDRISKDEKMQRIIELREKAIRDEHAIYAKGVDDGIEEGKAKGAREKQIEIAKSMLKENMDIEMIIKITGLTKQEIEKLQEM